jgi:hypothetical protein
MKWDLSGEKTYEVGIDRGVFFFNGAGVPWNGLVSVKEGASGGEVGEYHMDGMKYAQTVSSETFTATLEAFSSPSNFSLCDGRKEVYSGLIATSQKRYAFDLSYRTLIGDDVVATERGYKIHLVYNAIAAPSDVTRQTLSDSIDPVLYSWDLTTVPPYLQTYNLGIRPTAHLIIDSTKADPVKLAVFEDYIYGSDTTESQSPPIDTVWSIFNA